jgi:hypothetical protein
MEWKCVFVPLGDWGGGEGEGSVLGEQRDIAQAGDRQGAFRRLAGPSGPVVPIDYAIRTY